jgi:hypothetical protein
MIIMALSREQKAAKNEIRRARGRIWQQEIDRRKLETGCQWPGCSNMIDIPAQLEFAHLSQGDKNFDISTFVSRYSPHVPENWKLLEAEVAKCQVLCLLHHRLETIIEGHSGYRRGIRSGEAALQLVQLHPRPAALPCYKLGASLLRSKPAAGPGFYSPWGGMVRQIFRQLFW